MIVADGSAVVAIFLQEDAGDCSRRIAADDDDPVMSPPNPVGDFDCDARVEKDCAGSTASG
jgi:uncharacterized protein with PIN domain